MASAPNVSNTSFGSWSGTIRQLTIAWAVWGIIGALVGKSGLPQRWANEIGTRNNVQVNQNEMNQLIMQAAQQYSPEERQRFVEEFYGQVPGYDVPIDFGRKPGPLAKANQMVMREELKVENGGPGLPGESVIRPAGQAPIAPGSPMGIGQQLLQSGQPTPAPAGPFGPQGTTTPRPAAPVETAPAGIAPPPAAPAPAPAPASPADPTVVPPAPGQTGTPPSQPAPAPPSSERLQASPLPLRARSLHTSAL